MRLIKPIKYILILIVLSILVLLPILSQADTVRNFWLSNLNGERFNSKKWNQPFVVSFFFVGCVPCVKEIPVLYQILQKEYPKTKLLFIDPLKEDSKQEIIEFSENLGVPKKYFYHDSLGIIGKRFFKGKMRFPTIIGVNKNKILFRVEDMSDNSMKIIRNNLSSEY